jgi:hypothetical protein
MCLDILLAKQVNYETQQKSLTYTLFIPSFFVNIGGRNMRVKY